MNTTDFTFDIFKLTLTFYKDYPNTEYPEIMSKESRPYNCLLVSTNDYIMAIPYRTDLNEHNHFAYQFKTSKRSKNNASGLDYQKMIIITDTDYIESTGYSIDRDEYLETVKNIKRIVNEAVDYVETYKKHHSGVKSMNKWKYDRAYRFSTLKYFHSELGID